MGADLYGVNGAYFRDSYNDSNLLWQFGLSWWRDVIPMLDGGLLQPTGVKDLLAMIDVREEAFRRRTAKLDEEDRRYFEEKRKEFRAFLEAAALAGHAVECSL
jgi:hypothetical protein